MQSMHVFELTFLYQLVIYISVRHSAVVTVVVVAIAIVIVFVVAGSAFQKKVFEEQYIISLPKRGP